MLSLTQTPGSGERHVSFSGDCLTVSLTLSERRNGEAFVRTNLCRGGVRRREVIDQVEQGDERFGRDWHDIPMSETAPGVYSLTLPLCQVGMFEYKCYFLLEGEDAPLWVSGQNSRIKVEPVCTASNNTIYNAFVRQFGPNRQGGAWTADQRNAVAFLDGHSYTVVPPSGTFRDLKAELPFIMEEMGFRIIQLLPVHPTPIAFARMGRFGSPFAPLDFFTVDSSMAVFDRRTTPLEQFGELVDAIHAHHGLALIDLPADHTGWASTIQVHHPEWFCRNDDGSFASPGAWGVVWEDLCKLNFDDQRLWKTIAEVFLSWARMGVDGFRCDAGYMLPMRVWEYIAAKVRDQYPDTVFFLEGLGGPPQATEELLQEGRLNWAYSELFQCYDAQAIRDYLPKEYAFSRCNGMLVNFAETHDNDRLAARSRQWAELRTALAALTSLNGSFGIANGVEWFATEKIDVHGAASLNWGAPVNQIEHIKRLNRILRVHPAFTPVCRPQVSHSGKGDAVGILRKCPNVHDDLLVVVNPSDQAPSWFEWDGYEFEPGEDCCDLLCDAQAPVQSLNGRWHVDLAPGQVICLGHGTLGEWDHRDLNEWQGLRERVLKAVVHVYHSLDVTGVDVDGMARQMREDPHAFLRWLFDAVRVFRGKTPLQNIDMGARYLSYVEWNPVLDSRREAPILQDQVILVSHTHRFRAALMVDGHCLIRQESFRSGDGRHHAFFWCPSQPGDAIKASLKLEWYDGEETRRVMGKLLLLPSGSPRQVRLRLTKGQLDGSQLGLLTDSLGGYVQARASWGELQSKYDAFLAAVQAEDYPDERRVLVSRFRIDLNYRDFHIQLGRSCQTAFAYSPENILQWEFSVPTGMGQSIQLVVQYGMDRKMRNSCWMKILRKPSSVAGMSGVEGDPTVPVSVSPEVDFRINHSVTKAYVVGEQSFEGAVAPFDHGFTFNPGGEFGVRMESNASFHSEPSWNYGVEYAEDRDRGLDSMSDSFTPGCFRRLMAVGDCLDIQITGENLKGSVGKPSPLKRRPVAEMPLSMAMLPLLKGSLEAFVVRRGENKTVMAGYPWFLDWGRDTLICLRGLIAAGMFEESREIIRQFASFEDAGTIPNMIRGKDSGDRATSDAPLWLFVAIDDFVKAAPEGRELFSMDCGGRSLLGILESIVTHYHDGTPNGIKVDPTSGLVFSPTHYTWMDTNYPAGTPRQGYPVEIQALWIHALTMIVGETGSPVLAEWLAMARNSLSTLFPRQDIGCLSDCLFAESSGTPAASALADDAIRPNQLLALTLTDVFDSSPVGEAILDSCKQLLIPGAIRSLAPQPVSVPIQIEWYGRKLNDPWHPYWGQYTGDEDTRRKPSYHNGTAWGWLFPSYSEALVKIEGEKAIPAARSLLCSAIETLEDGCICFLPEICDGDAPHTMRGCHSQAWSVCEFYRVARDFHEWAEKNHDKNSI